MDRDSRFELVGIYPWEDRDTRLYRLQSTIGAHAGHQ